MDKQHDSIIRVGDTVQRISGTNGDMFSGDKGIVEYVNLSGWLRIKRYRGFMLHNPISFKKVIRC